VANQCIKLKALISLLLAQPASLQRMDIQLGRSMQVHIIFTSTPFNTHG
jgi:hypothetical protein